MSAVAPLIFVLLFCTGWAQGSDKSRFYGAELLEDGHSVLFSYTRAHYVVKNSSLVSFGGGRAWYTKDRKYIGMYDKDLGKTEVLLVFRMKRGSDGEGNFRIKSTRGRKALLYREPYQQEEERLSGEQFILDVDQKSLTSLPLDTEMTELGMEEWRTVWLAHGDGSLVVLAYSAGQKDGQKNSVPLGHVWLRSLAGDYRKLTELGSYDGTVGGAVLFYDHNLRKSHAYNLVNGETRTMGNRERADLKLYNTNYGKPHHTVHVSPDRDRKGLKIGNKIDGKWHYEPFLIDMSPLR